MKKIRDLFIKKDYLLDEPEVEKLLEYCESLEDQIVDYKFEKNYNKELIMLDMIKEIIKGCNDIQKKQEEHERFGFEAPNYEESIEGLKRYILDRCREEKIWL
jgi:hypothetical protein